MASALGPSTATQPPWCPKGQEQKKSFNLEDNVEHPLGPALYTISTLHCMTVSLAQGGEGLGTCWGEQLARRLLAEAGFKEVETHTVEGDVFNLYYVCRK